MSVVRHTLCGSFEMENLLVAFIFKFDLSKGQCWVNVWQIRWNLQNPNFLTETCLSLSQESKNVATTVDAGDMSPVTFGWLGTFPSKGPYDGNFVVVFFCLWEHALATDETFWDHESYTCMTRLRGSGPLFTLGAPASFRGPMVTKWFHWPWL